MKDRVLIASSVILVFIALMIGKYSHNSMGFEEAYWQILPITICGLSISFMVFALSKENSKSAFYESLKYSFGISSSILILGYSAFCLQPLIFN